MRTIISEIRKTPEITSNELAIEVSQLKSSPVSPSSIRTQLLKRGIRSFAARKTQFLTKNSQKMRLKWCQDHQNYGKEFWEKILFTDETMIEINPMSVINRVRRFSFENPYQMKYTCQKVKFPLKVMFWGGISSLGKTKLVECDKIMNSSMYIEKILKNHVKPFIEKNNEITLQQDNAPCHTSKVVKEFMNTNQIKKISWPANSPDLNIIENVWHKLKSKLRRMPIHSKKDLITKANKVWDDEITPEFIEKLLLSMNERLKNVIDNKGGSSGY